MHISDLQLNVDHSKLDTLLKQQQSWVSLHKRMFEMQR